MCCNQKLLLCMYFITRDVVFQYIHGAFLWWINFVEWREWRAQCHLQAHTHTHTCTDKTGGIIRNWRNRVHIHIYCTGRKASGVYRPSFHLQTQYHYTHSSDGCIIIISKWRMLLLLLLVQWDVKTRGYLTWRKHYSVFIRIKISEFRGLDTSQVQFKSGHH